MDTGLIALDKLQNIVADVFGNDFIIDNTERLLGGAQKHVYKIHCSNDFVFVLYLWHESTTYFTDEDDAGFTSNSAALFEINNTFMAENMINTPKLYFMDRAKKEHDYEFAFVEYIDGHDLDYIIDKEPERIKPIFESLNESIQRMGNIKRRQAGTVDNPLENFSCKDYVFREIQEEINHLVQVYSPIKNIHEQVSSCLLSLYQQCDDISSCSFIHNELGPNHVMVDKNNIAYLIDIEGAKFFDIEHEHSFLKFRFGENYAYLATSNLSDYKMEFYSFCHFIGILSGAYELSTKDYYDMDTVNGIINFCFGQIKSYCCKYAV